MSKTFNIIIGTIFIILIGISYYQYKKIDRLQLDNELKENAITSIQQGYEKAIEVEREEAVLQTKKQYIEKNSKLELMIKEKENGNKSETNSDNTPYTIYYF